MKQREWWHWGGKGLGTVEAGGRVADLKKEDGKILARYDSS